MTLLEICSKCGGEFRAYENGDGTAYGTCYNCGKSHFISLVPDEEIAREKELLANHHRGAQPVIRRGPQ